MTEQLFTTFRTERFLDSRQIAVTTTSPNGFQVSGGSVNLDYHYDSSLYIRGELKILKSLDKIYEAESGKSQLDRLAVVSLSLKI